MKFNTDEIASVLREEIDRYQTGIDVREVGQVLEVGDGIARVWGLSGVMAGEMVIVSFSENFSRLDFPIFNISYR